MNDAKINDPQMRAAMGAVAEGESHFKMGAEKSYATTSNDRIREVFKSKAGSMNDAKLTALKKDPEKFFNYMYGGRLGNAKDEGYKYRGRGFIQLTGKGNYEKYGKMAGVDLVKNPELLEDPAIAARVSVEYMKDRTKKGGGDIYERVARGVGNPVASTEAVKRQAFARNMQSGTFAPGREANLDGIQMAEAIPQLGATQTSLKGAKMQGAAPTKGAVLAETSKQDKLAERDSRTAMSSSQSPAESKKVAGEDLTSGKNGKNNVGNVEPVDARDRFKMLFGLVA